MPITMYSASAPVFAARLQGLAHFLAKGEAHFSERRIDPATILSARLAADMFPLTRQVQIATDHAKGAMSRLAGRDAPRYEDDETSFAELQARVAKTVDYVKSFEPAEIDGSEEKPIEIKAGPRTLSFTGEQYLLHFAMPNFYFHVTTAYDILRHNGVAIGKSDYFGGR